MNKVIEEIFEVPYKDLRTELQRLSIEFNVRPPQEIAEQLIYADAVYRYPNAEEFSKKAPSQLLQVSKLNKLIKTLEKIKKVVEEKDELHRMAVFLGSIAYPPRNVRIGFMARSLKEATPHALFRSPHRIEEMKEQFETLLAAYISEYLKFHAEINEKLLDLKDKVYEIEKKITVMRKLQDIPQMHRYCSGGEIMNIEFNVKNMLPCEHSPTVEEVAKYFFCPKCHRTFMDEGLVSILLDTAEKCDRAFDKCVNELSKQLSQKIVQTEDDAMKSIIDAVSVSDLSKLTNILSDELIERIKLALVA